MNIISNVMNTLTIIFLLLTLGGINGGNEDAKLNKDDFEAKANIDSIINDINILEKTICKVGK